MVRISLNGNQSSPLEAAMMSHVFESGEFEKGEFLDTLEKQLAQAHGYEYCATVDSGQTALSLCLEGWGKESGPQTVAISALADISVFRAAIQARYKPVIVDVDENCFSMKEELIPNVSVILLSHLL